MQKYGTAGESTTAFNPPDDLAMPLHYDNLYTPATVPVCPARCLPGAHIRYPPPMASAMLKRITSPHVPTEIDCVA